MTYPAIIVDENGDQTAGNTIEFTDPDNQPSAGPPFVVADSGETAILKNSDGDTLLDFDADSDTLEIHTKATVGGDFTVAGHQIDAGSLGPSIPYVTVQAGAPSADYLTPILVDTTAVSGATYAWDGAAYVKIADLLT